MLISSHIGLCVNLIYSWYIDLGSANRPYMVCVARKNTSTIMFYYILLDIFGLII